MQISAQRYYQSIVLAVNPWQIIAIVLACLDLRFIVGVANPLVVLSREGPQQIHPGGNWPYLNLQVRSKFISPMQSASLFMVFC